MLLELRINDQQQQKALHVLFYQAFFSVRICLFCILQLELFFNIYVLDILLEAIFIDVHFQTVLTHVI